MTYAASTWQICDTIITAEILVSHVEVFSFQSRRFVARPVDLCMASAEESGRGVNVHSQLYLCVE